MKRIERMERSDVFEWGNGKGGGAENSTKTPLKKNMWFFLFVVFSGMRSVAVSRLEHLSQSIANFGR